MQNARQLRSIVVAAYPEFERLSHGEKCENSASDVGELACRWREAMHVVKSKDRVVEETLARVLPTPANTFATKG